MPSRILEILTPHFDNITTHLDGDQEFQSAARAAIPPSESSVIKFGIASSDSDGKQADWVVLTLKPSDDGRLANSFSAGGRNDADFFLHARPEDWRAFFAPDAELVRPYQSFWGMLRVLGPLHEEVCIIGDGSKFARHSRIWRMALDSIRNVINRKAAPHPSHDLEVPSEEFEDGSMSVTSIIGKYAWIDHSRYGKVKIFYEQSGTGDQAILFLHTAGSDSRQYHSLMSNSSLKQKCTMFAFDLPAHGRSSLGTRQIPEAYALTEQDYLESIDMAIKSANMNSKKNLILCGASMAGHVCLAAAIHARALGIRGVIPCEGCAHLPSTQSIYELKGADTSLLDPERVCGMIAPTSPEYYKRQIWWQYSSQGTGVFAGDLKFYFQGWDGRERLSEIDTRYCPVYMLTGQYDYSCTTEASRETAAKIPGAEFEEMKNLGHFPLTENPKAVLPYLLRAIEHVQSKREEYPDIQ